MIEPFKASFLALLAQVPHKHYRYLYPQLSLANRLLGIVGPRGVGKTTLMLQFIKNKLAESLNKTLYFSADHIFFSQTSLVEFVHDAYFNHGIRYFFIDEIHQDKHWTQALKNIYDSYPEAHIMFSGSSSIDLIQGTYDLSRRAILRHLEGLSFREYLNFTTDSNHPVISAADLLQNAAQFDAFFLSLQPIKQHFNTYLREGYYPFIFSDEEDYYQRINRIIDKTIYEDIALFYKLKTENLHCMKRILSYLTTIPPGQVNTNNLARYLSMDNKTVFHYLTILSESGLIHLLHPQSSGNQMLRKVEKIYLNNTTLQYALNDQLASAVEMGTIRELFFIQSLMNSGIPVYYNKHGDFEIDSTIIEIGGKNKTRAQISQVGGLLVKDDITTSTPLTIPLYYWGFCY